VKNIFHTLRSRHQNCTKNTEPSVNDASGADVKTRKIYLSRLCYMEDSVQLIKFV